MQGGWPSVAIFDWLKNCLFERFGQSFYIALAEASSIKLGLPGSALSIALPVNHAAFSRTDSELPCSSWDPVAEGWASVFGKPLAAPGADALPTPLIKLTETGYFIQYDIFGLCYWMLARLEEINPTSLDKFARFPAASSHAFKHDYLEYPVVDAWLHILGQIIKRVWPALELKKHQFKLAVSHDVDAPSRYGYRNVKGVLRAMGGDILKRRDLRSAFLGPWVRLNTKARLHWADPAKTFDWLMDASEKHGLTSVFYFICGHTDPIYDADYEIEHPAIRNLLRDIHARGHEIGLHLSYETYRDPDKATGEAARLLRVCREEGIELTGLGGRMHYLRWEHPTTMRVLEAAGLAYDNTLTYANCAGFRCGTCFEYPAFDPMQSKQLGLRIRPLIAMEASVMAQQHMGLGTGEKAFEKFSELKDTCKRVGGTFMLLWHNTQLDTLAKKELYAAVLAH